MATTQYIGARYVPTFADPVEWSAGRAFEPLTIVTYGGNSYTSKKPVPASIGNPASNPAYWASTGIYNQQIEAYRQEVQQVSADLQDLSEDVDDLDTRLSTLNPYAALQGKRIGIFGASNEMDQSGRWPVYMRQILSGIATVDTYGVSGRLLSNTMTVVEQNYMNYDYIIVVCTQNDAINDIVIGSTYPDTPTTSYGYNFRRLRTCIENSVDANRHFFVRGLLSAPFSSIYTCKYPWNMYGMANLYGAKYAGAAYINAKYAFGNLPPSVAVAHPGGPRQEFAARYMINKLINGDSDYEPFEGQLADTTYEGTTYNRVSDLFTKTTTASQAISLNRIKCTHDNFELWGTINKVLTAGEPLITFDQGLVDSLDIGNNALVVECASAYGPKPLRFNYTNNSIVCSETYDHYSWFIFRAPYGLSSKIYF